MPRVDEARPASGRRVPMADILIVVNRRPYVFWHEAPLVLLQQYLDGYDTEFFEVVGRVFRSALLEEKKSKSVALAVRLAYSQAIEALFSVLFSALQAPLAPLVWQHLYRQGDLRTLIGRVNEEEAFPVAIDFWGSPYVGVPGRVLLGPSRLAPRFEMGQRLRQTLAAASLGLPGPRATAEYNGLKHGLRQTPSSHTLLVGGHLVTESDYGSAGYSLDLHEGVHISVENSWRNWDPVGYCDALKLISFSIHNILQVVRLIGLGKQDELVFKYPDSREEAKAPLANPRAHGSMSFRQVTLDTSCLPKLQSREALLEQYERNRRPCSGQ